MIKGIFFDVGGTLYSYRNMRAAMTEMMETLATRLEMDVAEVAREYQLATKEVDQLVAAKSFYLFRDYFEIIFTNFLNRIGKPQLFSHFVWLEKYQREAITDSLVLMPDCHDSLARLKGMGLYLSAVSNSDENHLEPLMARAQMHRWLTHWTSSEEARSCKPDKQFFEVALNKSGLSPDQVLFVGDSIEQDIQGAHAVGMSTVLISETPQPAPMHIGREVPGPDFSITRLSELPEIIEDVRRHVAAQ